MSRSVVKAVRAFLGVTAFAIAAGSSGRPAVGARPIAIEGLTPKPCHVKDIDETLRCATLHVYEDAQARTGRQLPINIVVIPAQSKSAGPPIFMIPGGPGEVATEFASQMVSSWLRKDHDLVLVDERGTGKGNALVCSLPGSDDDPEGQLQTIFRPALAASCLRELSGRVRLSEYNSWAAAEDIEDARKALGYNKIILAGGSFGTHLSLMYIKAYGRNVHAALLTSLVLLENRVPLYHAAAAQRAFNILVDDCNREASCKTAYPDLKGDLATILTGLAKAPAPTSVRHPVTGASIPLRLTRQMFVEHLRSILYSDKRRTEVPYLLHRASAGDFAPFAQLAVDRARGSNTNFPYGLHLAVTCGEFVRRIRKSEIEPATRGSFYGDARVEGQMAACRHWPRTRLPADFFREFKSGVPALMITGHADPVTPPEWGERARRILPNSIHLVIPGAHFASNDCTEKVAAEFLRTADPKHVDLSCMAKVKSMPFVLPADRNVPAS